MKKHLEMELVESSIQQMKAEISTKIMESKDPKRIKALKECESLTRQLFSSILAKHLNIKL